MQRELSRLNSMSNYSSLYSLPCQPSPRIIPTLGAKRLLYLLPTLAAKIRSGRVLRRVNRRVKVRKDSQEIRNSQKNRFMRACVKAAAVELSVNPCVNPLGILFSVSCDLDGYCSSWRIFYELFLRIDHRLLICAWEKSTCLHKPSSRYRYPQSPLSSHIAKKNKLQNTHSSQTRFLDPQQGGQHTYEREKGMVGK